MPRSTPVPMAGATGTGRRRSTRRSRCLRAGRRSAPRSSPRSRCAPGAGRPRPRSTTSGAALAVTGRTTCGRCATTATRRSRTGRPGGCRRHYGPSHRGHAALNRPAALARACLSAPGAARCGRTEPIRGAFAQVNGRFRGALLERSSPRIMLRDRAPEKAETWVGESGAAGYPSRARSGRVVPHPRSVSADSGGAARASERPCAACLRV